MGARGVRSPKSVRRRGDGGVKRHTSAFGISSSIFNLISFTSVVLESGRLSATSRITSIVIAVSQEFTIIGAFSVNR